MIVNSLKCFQMCVARCDYRHLATSMGGKTLPTIQVIVGDFILSVPVGRIAIGRCQGAIDVLLTI
jgi:hypothetical protein